MKILRDVGDARRFVYGNKVALLALLNTESHEGKLLMRVLSKLERISKGIIAYAVLKVDNHDDPPIITLFINGRQAFEQDTYFGHEAKDLQALKWGIRETLRNWGLEPPF